MGVEERDIAICGREVVTGRLEIEDAHPWTLWLMIANEEYSSVGADFFDSLQNLRGLLEPDGQMLCVQGACRDVFPSGMSRQMSGGRSAYRFVAGRRPGREDLVDIFAPAACDRVVGVDEQITTVRELRAATRPSRSLGPPQWAVDEAKTVPNGWVYELDGEFGTSERVPPEASRGAWPVGPDGVIKGAFMPNPRFRSERDCPGPSGTA